ncbi:hypothetical protein [Streptomyces boluensis]|uniref:Uncharacterized protein n=1 Tax=Streptomyces boluensis TaxID=1775135 RepID=A0A964XJJ3_9ACTN|nr:hypothetical protein [Streptomyces boluensis]NBE50106.1 hypothetical protein [Streptomyces boluensis]
MSVHLQEEPAITAIRTTLIATGCAAVVLAGTTACDPIESASAGRQVDDAVAKLGEQHSLSVELSLDADPATLEELVGRSDGVRGGDGPPPGFGAFLGEARLQVALRSKKPLADTREKDFSGKSMKIAGADGTLVEYRALGEDTYYRADLRAFGELAKVPMPSAGDLPPQAGSLRSVLEGDWIRVAPGTLPGPAQRQRTDEKARGKLLKGIQRVLAREVTFKGDTDADGTGRIKAKAHARSLLKGIVNKLEPMADELPPGSELPTAKDFKSLPNKPVTVEFEIENGKLRQVTFDLAQLADKSDGLQKGTELPLTVKFGTAGKIERPADATELKPADLMFLGGAGLIG